MHDAPNVNPAPKTSIKLTSRLHRTHDPLDLSPEGWTGVERSASPAAFDSSTVVIDLCFTDW